MTSPPATADTADTHAGRRHVLFVAVIVALTAGLYAPTLSNPLLFDDVDFIRKNPYIGSLRNIDAFFNPTYWNEERPGRSYRPLAEASTTLNWVAGRALARAFGWDPGSAAVTSLRAVNVALLAAVGALVYLLVWRLARSCAAALIAGLVFAAHPTHLETITVIKNRSELQAALFGLLALLWFLRGATGTRRGRWWVWWLASIAATAAALGSKEVALALPLVITAAAILLVPSPSPSQGEGRGEGETTGRSRRTAPHPNPLPTGERGFAARHSRRRALILTVPVWLLAAGFVVLLFASMPMRYGQPPATDRLRYLEFAALGPFERGLVTVKTAGTYLGLLVWPFALCTERGFAIPRGLGEAAVLASLGGCLTVAVIAVWSWRRARLVVFGLLWMLLTIAPVANLVPVATRPIAEQRLFAATIPFALLVGLVLARLGALWFVRETKRCQVPFPEKVPDTIFCVSATVVLAAWLAATGATVLGALPIWRSGLDLWERTARHPLAHGSWRAQFNYGTTLLKARRCRAAIGQLERAGRLDDLQIGVLQNMAFCFRQTNRYAEAKRLARLALAWDPDYDAAHDVLAWTLVYEGQAERALYEAREALRLAPGDGRHHAAVGFCLLRAGRPEEAIAPLRRACELRPHDAGARLTLADALEAAGRLDEALDECRAVIDRWAGKQVALAAHARAQRILSTLRRP